MSSLDDYFKQEVKDSLDPKVSIIEPYYGQMDPKITNLILKYPQLEGYEFFFSHLFRTCKLTWEQAKRMELLCNNMIKEDKMWFSNIPDVLRLLDKIQVGALQVIWGDAYNGSRQNYLGTTRKRIEFSESSEEQRKKGFLRLW